MIVETRSVLREMLRLYCHEALHHDAVEMVGSLGNAMNSPANVILLSAELAEQTTAKVIQSIRDSSVPRPAFLVYGTDCSFQRMRHLELIYADGYFDLATEKLETLDLAVRSVGSERRYFSDSFFRRQDERRDNSSAYSKILTDRQISVLQFMGRFLTDSEISQKLGLSVRTVEWHRLEIMRKLEKNSIQAILRYAWDQGFVPVPASNRQIATFDVSIGSPTALISTPGRVPSVTQRAS